jgi:hypothetical protein
MPTGSPSVASKRFCLVLVKPTHYCDDGYPIRWFRSAIPSNSLASLYGIAEDCAARNVLGEDVDIEIHALDEANTRIRPERIAALIMAADAGIVTPLPGSEDHQKLFRAGAWMDPDLNKYDLHHITCAHPRMSEEEWAYAYRESWTRYYSFEHCERVMRRAAALRAFGNVLFVLTWFKASFELENCHPVESGLLRLKSRRDRRTSMPLEPIWLFYPKYFAELVYKTIGWAAIYLRLRLIYLRIKYNPKRYEYTDLAIAPVTDEEVETHEMFGSDAARAFVESERRIQKIIRESVAASEIASAPNRIAN